jgi:hypothetical protein
MLAGLLPLALIAWRGLVRSRISLYALALIGAVVALSPIIVPPVWTLLTQRFTSDTGSYDARLAALDAGTSRELADRLLIGGGDFGRSTHTMVLDATLRGGIVAGVAAVIVIGVFLRHTVRAAGAFKASGDVAAIAAFGLGSLALVRAFTGGGGLLHLVEWCAVAALVVAEIDRDRRSRSGTESTTPHPGGPADVDSVTVRPA